MKKLSNTFMVDKKDGENATSVMEKVFGGSEDENMFSNVYRIVEWKMSDWFIKNSVKQKKEDIYLYVDSIPDYFKSYTVENDKYLRICVKHKIKSDSDGYKKIKSRFMIKNLKSSYKTIINGLDLIKIINYMEITDVPNTMLVNVKIDTNISLSIPMKDDFENYLIDIFNMINENLKNKLSTS